jgi:hypothetical protein
MGFLSKIYFSKNNKNFKIEVFGTFQKGLPGGEENEFRLYYSELDSFKGLIFTGNLQSYWTTAKLKVSFSDESTVVVDPDEVRFFL